ncbi:hypothetical protein [Tenggerimyces flavus]|uniref:Uncharacterized protein n=1 Tax=Tenggerimyces flavus TaxID=1708749 RepID=A0ABV7YJ12_9ACTN|nr:hypothetical protein [Tenggerimyces flavus]MBM7784537.1 hypothetical protein [Tenggerimyces flavus]
MRRIVVALVCTVLGVVAGTLPAAAADPAPVLVVGIAGLRWTDVTPEQTPNLSKLAGNAALGTVTVRAVHERACPLDGWLTLSAGRRAGGPQDCGELPDVVGGKVEGWPELVAAQQQFSYRATPGGWGEQVTCATAVGRGAAVALADRQGNVDRYVEEPSIDALDDCPLTVVDAGAIPAGSGREAAVKAADVRLGQALGATTRPTTVLVAGLSDEPNATGPALRVALATGRGFDTDYLTSHSTRWPGLVQLPDLRATVTELLALPKTDDEPNTQWENGKPRPEPAEAARELTGIDTAAQVLREQAIPLIAVIAAVVLLAFGAAVLRRSHLAAALGLLGAAFPVSAYAAGLIGWWRSDSPTRTAWIAVVVCALLVAALAYGARRALPHLRFVGPATVAAVTVVVLAADVITGSNLQHTTLLGSGVSPILAGRFFGFGNVAFSVFAASVLLLLGALATQVNGRLAKGGVVLGVGLLAVAVDGWPDWGADFGGVLALVPAVLLLAANVANIRLTPLRVILAGLAAVVVVGGIAVADWLRPAADRTHLGGFVQQILDGELWPALLRKLETSFGIAVAAGVLSLIAIPVFIAVFVTVFRPDWFRANGLIKAYESWPTLKPSLQAVVVAAIVGFALNDSGLVVPATMLMTALPLVVVASVSNGRVRERA